MAQDEKSQGADWINVITPETAHAKKEAFLQFWESESTKESLSDKGFLEKLHDSLIEFGLAKRPRFIGKFVWAVNPSTVVESFDPLIRVGFLVSNNGQFALGSNDVETTTAVEQYELFRKMLGLGFDDKKWFLTGVILKMLMKEFDGFGVDQQLGMALCVINWQKWCIKAQIEEELQLSPAFNIMGIFQNISSPRVLQAFEALPTLEEIQGLALFEIIDLLSSGWYRLGHIFELRIYELYAGESLFFQYFVRAMSGIESQVARKSFAKLIIEDFILESGAFQINIPFKTRQRLEDFYENDADDLAESQIFMDAADKEIQKLVRDLYVSFVAALPSE